jgi:hypothetical protein
LDVTHSRTGHSDDLPASGGARKNSGTTKYARNQFRSRENDRLDSCGSACSWIGVVLPDLDPRHLLLGGYHSWPSHRQMVGCWLVKLGDVDLGGPRGHLDPVHRTIERQEGGWDTQRTIMARSGRHVRNRSFGRDGLAPGAAAGLRAGRASHAQDRPIENRPAWTHVYRDNQDRGNEGHGWVPKLRLSGCKGPARGDGSHLRSSSRKQHQSATSATDCREQTEDDCSQHGLGEHDVHLDQRTYLRTDTLCECPAVGRRVLQPAVTKGPQDFSCGPFSMSVFSFLTLRSGW